MTEPESEDFEKEVDSPGTFDDIVREVESAARHAMGLGSALTKLVKKIKGKPSHTPRQPKNDTQA